MNSPALCSSPSRATSQLAMEKHRRKASLSAAFVALALVFPFSSATAAQTPREKDSKPILMSRTGGGSTFADLPELQAAAAKGNAKAEAQLGEMLLKGDPALKLAADRPKALTLLESAARKGEASAAFRLGMVYDDGDGVMRDRDKALAYFRAAAAGGVTEAMHNIGAAYASARGVKRDYAEGLAWLIVAKQRGSESAAEASVRAQIQKLKRPELVTAAEKRAAEIDRELSTGKVASLLPPPASAAPSPTTAPAPTAAPTISAPAAPSPAISAPQIAPPIVAPRPTIAPPKIAPPAIVPPSGS